VLARVPRLCKPGRSLDRLGHGSGEVRPWSAEMHSPVFWVLHCR
jgi:hypothetical protein